MSTQPSQDNSMLPPEFPILRLSDDAGHAIEPMGSKPKFWYRHDTLGRCLYKQARPGTGEDWAEKVAAELAEILGLPHAGVELAEWRDTRGIVSPSFVPEGGDLIHGNEILLRVVPGYPGGKPGPRNFYRVPQHTLDVVLAVMAADVVVPPLNWAPPPGILDAVGVFVGYLLLDAWIGNTDRHHENWAFVVHAHRGPPRQASLHLAPTYDHASSLGRNEPDEKRQQRLSTMDPGFSVRAYVEKATSALYAREGDSKPLTTFDAFAEAARRYPAAARVWIERLASLKPEDTRSLFDRLPDDRISAVGAAFAQEILVLNRRRLLELREALP